MHPQQYREHYIRIEDSTHYLRASLGILADFAQSSPAHGILSTLWSTEEDKLVLYCEDMKEIDWAKVYRIHRREQPHVFNKPNIDSAALKQRLNGLRSEVARLQLIRQSSQDAMGSLVASPMARSTIFPEEVRSTVPVIVDATTSTTLTNVPHVTIKCVCRTAKNTGEVNAPYATLVKHSAYMKDILSGGPARVTLSEMESCYRDHETMYDVFGVDNVTCFVQFINNPEPWEQKKQLESQLTELQSTESQKWDAFFASYNMKHKQQIEALKQQEIDDLKAVETQLAASLERDITALKRLYAQHKIREVSKISANYEDTIRNVDLFYRVEADRLRAVSNKMEMKAISDLQDRIKELSKVTEALLPEDSLLRLLMLSDVMHCMSLRDACLRSSVESINTLHFTEKWSSPILKVSTIRELLTMLNDATVTAIQQSARTGMPQHLLEEEVVARRAMFIQKLRTLVDEQLLALARDTSPNITVWQNEIASELLRREQGQDQSITTFKYFSPSEEHVKIVNSEQTAVVPQRILVDTVAALSLGKRIGCGWGRWYWETTIDAFDASFGGTVGVGLDIVSGGCASATSPAVMWSSDGIIRVQDQVAETSHTYGEGDVLALVLDLHTNTIVFKRNGTEAIQVRRLITSGAGGPSTQTAIPLMEAFNGLTLHPCVYFYRTSYAQQMMATVNVTPPFKFPVPALHRAYGDRHPRNYTAE
jgi:hypothetical protein